MKIPYITIIALQAILILFLVKCNNKPAETVKVPIRIEVPVPAQEGTTDTIFVPIPKYVYIPKQDDSILLAYNNAKDSLERLNILLDAITIREYENVFSDSIIDITTTTKVRGSLISQYNDYFIHPYVLPFDTTLNVAIPHKNALYASAGIRSRLDNFQPIPSFHFHFLNKKDRMFSVGVDLNSEFYLGYGIRF